MFFKRVKELREDNDLLQKDIANIIKKSQQHYSKLELDKSELTAEDVFYLSEFYKVSADYILGLINKK